jgi:hypothetical protein
MMKWQIFVFVWTCDIQINLCKIYFGYWKCLGQYKWVCFWILFIMSNSIVCDDHIIQDLNKLLLHLIKFFLVEWILFYHHAPKALLLRSILLMSHCCHWCALQGTMMFFYVQLNMLKLNLAETNLSSLHDISMMWRSYLHIWTFICSLGFLFCNFSHMNVT